MGKRPTARPPPNPAIGGSVTLRHSDSSFGKPRPMAKTARDDLPTPQRVRFDMRSLRRLAAWGACAALSLTLAVLAASSEPGSQRLASLGAGKATAARSAVATGAQPTQPPSDAEAKRLAEAVRILAADRDRMLARINSLQQNLDDVTGAINRPSQPSASATPPAPAPGKPPNPPPRSQYPASSKPRRRHRRRPAASPSPHSPTGPPRRRSWRCLRSMTTMERRLGRVMPVPIRTD
jgi:pyruvate/2-oxoglutarate dehydrogenase complex dihydrolipoamide acyltransferase (E2) component